MQSRNRKNQVLLFLLVSYGRRGIVPSILATFFDISSCSLPIQTIDILAKMNGEEFTWRDVESIRDYPVGHVWTTMYLCDEDWCLCIKDDQNGIPGITFYMYDERNEKNNGMIW